MDPRSEQTLLKKTYRWPVATQKDALYHTDHQGEANQFRNSSAQIICFCCWAVKELCAYFINSLPDTSVQFSHSVMADSLRPHGLQHARPSCPSPTPGAYSNSCPSRRWCHPTISSSAIFFSSCLQSFSASGSFQMSQFFTSGCQSIGVSASASVLPMNIQDSGLISFRMNWLDLLAVQGTLKTLLQHHFSKASILWRSAFFIVQLSHPYMTTGKTIALTRYSLLFNMLSTLVTAFLPRSKLLLISRLQSPSIVILQPKKIKSVTVSIVSPSISHEVWDRMPQS